MNSVIHEKGDSMKGIAIALGMLLLISGCTGATLPPERMGSTARCLHDAKTKFETGTTAYKSAVNECMWTKGLDLKD